MSALTLATDSTTANTETDLDEQEVAPPTPTNRNYSRSSNSRYSRSHGRNSRGSRHSRGGRSRQVTIQQGDNLSKIAKRNHTTVAELKRKNNIKGDRIRAGQKIRVK